MPETPTVGDRLDLDSGGGGRLAGRVVDVAPRRVALLLDEPAPGTAFVAAEGHGTTCALSVWAYLYGEDRDRLAAELTSAWQGWLDARTPDAAPARRRERVCSAVSRRRRSSVLEVGHLVVVGVSLTERLSEVGRRSRVSLWPRRDGTTLTLAFAG